MRQSSIPSWKQSVCFLADAVPLLLIVKVLLREGNLTGRFSRSLPEPPSGLRAWGLSFADLYTLSLEEMLPQLSERHWPPWSGSEHHAFPAFLDREGASDSWTYWNSSLGTGNLGSTLCH